MRFATDWNETEFEAARAANALDDAACDFGGDLVKASYAARDILECVAPPLEPKRALHTVEVSGAAVTGSIQDVEVRLHAASEARGTFSLMLEGYETQSIDLNVSDAQLQFKLNQLPSIGFVTVTSNSSIIVEAGTSWSTRTYRVVFRTREGPTPTLVVDDSGLMMGAPGDAVRAYAIERGTTGASVAEEQTIRIRQPVPSNEIQRIALEARRSFGNERQRITFESDAALSGTTWQVAHATETTAPLNWDASADAVRAALEGLRGIGRLDVVRRPAGTRGFAWTVEFLDERASYHSDLTELTEAPTYETGAPTFDTGAPSATPSPSRQPTVDGVTDFRRPLLTATSSATVVVTRVRPRVTTPDGQFWLGCATYEARAGPLGAEASSDDLEAAIYDAWGVTVQSTTSQEPRGWAWTVEFPETLGDVPLLTVNENWYHFANMTISAVRPGVKQLDGGLVLRTTSPRTGATNTSRTLSLNGLTAAEVRRALEETLSLESMVTVQRDVLHDVPCANFSGRDVSPSSLCRGFDYRVTFPATLGNVQIVRADLAGTSKSCRADAATVQVTNGTWAPLAGTWNLTAPSSRYQRRHAGGVERFMDARETVDLPWNATAERVRRALVDVGVRVSGVVRTALESHRGRAGFAWRLYYADAGARPLPRCGAQDGTFRSEEHTSELQSP